MSVLLPQAVGLRKAREMSFTGDFVDAAEAYRLGLANHVVPHDELARHRDRDREHHRERRPGRGARARRTSTTAAAALAPGPALELELDVFRNRRLPAETIEARRGGTARPQPRATLNYTQPPA